MAEYIEAKGILSKLRGRDTWFGITYNMNLYRGCQHGCIYCDTRSDCYGIGDISHISVKRNAIELLDRALRSKRTKGTIGTGSMNDPYMPLEKKERLTRRALETIAVHKFPVHIITKGTLITRDTDIISEISKTYAAVSFTVTSADDNLVKTIEPGAPASSERLAAMENLAAAGIYTGITMMPLLPLINDTEENIRQIVVRAADAGASYILPAFGLTMRNGSREWLYKEFDRSFPGMSASYREMFGESYICDSPQAKKLYGIFRNEISKHGLEDKMRFYEPPAIPEQMKLF